MSDESAEDAKDSIAPIATGSTYTATAPGWYCVEVSSLLNRKTEKQMSKVIKITDKPIPPQVEKQESLYESCKNEPVTFTVNVDSDILDTADKLVCDKIHYIWQMMIPDHSWENVSGNESGITVNNNSITIDNKFAYAFATFRCLVINELNGAKTIFDHSNAFAPADDKLGEFKKEVPYIFGNDEYFDFTVKNY
jgi:hypothetical protein